MNLEALPKYYSPKSPKLSDDAPATGTGCLKGLFWMKKEPGFMAYRYIRFVGVVMETGLVVYRPRWHDVMSRSWYQT